MADTDVAAPELSHDEHVAAAQDHAAHVVKHLDAARAPDADTDELTGDESELSGGDGGGSASRSVPGSAQSRTGFAAGSGAARSYDSMRSGRR